MDPNEIYRRLTERDLNSTEKRRALMNFAENLGWKPSEAIVEENENAASCGHLIIEHGLDNAAVISFLRRGLSFSRLDYKPKMDLLALSYNNLVDWHLFPEFGGLTLVNNRIDPIVPRQISIGENPLVWHAQSFEAITERSPRTNLKALDDALIETIAFWKRALPSEVDEQITTTNLSTLFNSLILVRAYEDHYNISRHLKGGNLLLEVLDTLGTHNCTLLECIRTAFKHLNQNDVPNYILNHEDLTKFNSLDPSTIYDLLKDFYINKYAPYPYDFSVISKHALTRVYEKYVTLLRDTSSAQGTFLPSLWEEVSDKSLGGIYTPQYIARFFTRYLQENLTPRAFRDLSSLDPACGSGIFLRSLLEAQCSSLNYGNLREDLTNVFENVSGIDIDPNACRATALSLSLLHLTVNETFPDELNILNMDTLLYNTGKANKKFKAVIANPPYIKWDSLTPETQQRLLNALHPYTPRKPDLYMGFLKGAMDHCTDDGFLLFVLPRNFMIAENAKELRKELCNSFWIRFIADLSEINVFDGVGAYVILLVAQKKSSISNFQGTTTALLCKDFVGVALEDALLNKETDNTFYKIFSINQDALSPKQWQLVPPRHHDVQLRLNKLPTIDQVLSVKQGFITGANDVFIIPSSAVPNDEESLYAPYLADREMLRYRVPQTTELCVFYPYLKGVKITENELKTQFPKTYRHLSDHKEKLSRRSSVVAGGEWWCPSRSRAPKDMMRPKIVTPHLTLFPKFALDPLGKYAVSHGPYLTCKGCDDLDVLRFFVGVLNSRIVNWQMQQLLDRYKHGYGVLELKTLKRIRVPDLSDLTFNAVFDVVKTIKELEEHPNSETEVQLDQLIQDCYGLPENAYLELEF